MAKKKTSSRALGGSTRLKKPRATASTAGRTAWRPIATAPTDVPRWTPVDLWLHIYASMRSFGMSDSFRVADCWRNDDGKWVHKDGTVPEAELYEDYITHWMPLPEPPK